MNAIFGGMEERLRYKTLTRMTDRPRKTEPPFGFDMNFDKALERFKKQEKRLSA